MMAPLGATSVSSPRDPESAPWACGLLAVDKPTGITSHDVVERVRRRLHVRSAGHLGTLDPGASGLLLVALGPATRCAPVWQGGEKTYEGTVRFGVVSSTQDLQGEIEERHEALPSEAAVREATHAFIGEIDQVPPMASAVHVRGERLYRMHRRGETIERAPRRVVVQAWEWTAFAPAEARFIIRCGPGTYVRTLAHDLGRSLGCGAALAALRRIASAPFTIERSVPLGDVVSGPPESAWARAGYSLDEALAHLPALRLEAAEVEAVGFGRRPELDRARAGTAPIAGGPRSVVLVDPRGHALGLGGIELLENGRLSVCPRVLLPWAVRDGRHDGDRAAL